MISVEAANGERLCNDVPTAGRAEPPVYRCPKCAAQVAVTFQRRRLSVVPLARLAIRSDCARSVRIDGAFREAVLRTKH